MYCTRVMFSDMHFESYVLYFILNGRKVSDYVNTYYLIIFKVT